MLCLYRTMRADLDDLKNKDHEARTASGADQVLWVIKSICEGSKQGRHGCRSPYLHGSINMRGAQYFRAMANSSRQETNTFFIAIMIWDAYCDGELAVGDVIDVSTREAYYNLICGSLDDYPDYVRENIAKAIQWSTMSHEVLVKWRGTLSMKYYKVQRDGFLGPPRSPQGSPRPHDSPGTPTGPLQDSPRLPKGPPGTTRDTQDPLGVPGPPQGTLPAEP